MDGFLGKAMGDHLALNGDTLKNLIDVTFVHGKLMDDQLWPNFFRDPKQTTGSGSLQIYFQRINIIVVINAYFNLLFFLDAAARFLRMQDLSLRSRY